MTKHNTKHRRARRGITLVEVLVGLAILLVMSAVIFESLHNSIEFHNLLSARDETLRTARSALGKMGRDLQLAYLTPNRGAISSYQTVFVGTDGELPKVYFASLNHQRLYLNSRECDQTEITLWAEPAPEGRGRGNILYHREAPRIDEEPDEQGRIWPLAYNVRTFRLRYLEQISGEWRNEWDTRSADTPYRLPRAIEIGLVLIMEDPEDPSGTVDVPFLSTVVLEYAERLPSTQGPLAAGGTASPGGPGGGSSTSSSMANNMGQQLMGGGGALPGGNGGMGGMGFLGLSGGPVTGGALSMMPGAKPRGGAGGRGAAPPTGATRGGGQ